MMAEVDAAVIDRDLFRPKSPYRRFWLYALLVVVLAFVAKLVIEGASRPRHIRNVRLTDCIAGAELCKGEDVYLEGAYVPGSLGAAPGCRAALELQAPGGEPQGKLAVCLKSPYVPATLYPDGCRDSRMSRVLANGYYALRVAGQLKGTQFYATELFGGCDARFYAWKYGPAAVAEAR